MSKESVDMQIAKANLKEIKDREKKLKETPGLLIELHKIKGNEHYPFRLLMRFKPKGAMRFYMERDTINDMAIEIRNMMIEVFGMKTQKE